MKANREEILNLHTKTEEDQCHWLVAHGYMKGQLTPWNGEGCYETYESLADCAFRLRDEFCQTITGDRVSARWWITLRDLLLEIDVYDKYDFNNAKPIHCIQAALLAKLEKEHLEKLKTI